VLKALVYAPTGAVVAAPTTSLPEAIGGERNWDYRYTWIRDATVTLISLRILGYRAEADAFKAWLETAAGGRPDALQIMYGVGGEADLPEYELDHLAGHRDSKPVRIGNGAAKQSQHDSYGQLVEATWLYVRGGGTLSERNRRFVSRLVDVAAERWRTPDHGIWEIRADPRQFVHSTLHCWIAFDRAVELVEAGELTGDVDRWIAERDASRAHLEDLAKRVGWFPQASGSEVFEAEADAAALLVPAMGLLPADDPAVVATVDRVREKLSEKGLLLRYRADDGLDGGEGVFLLCSFWLVDVLTHQGRLHEAEELLERLIGLSNDVGLFAEETDAATGEALGNFPQAFTHMALITSCAHVTAAREGRIPAPSVAHDFAASAVARLIAEGRA
jgi:GH15 family glucan-1,4-alpha-glucosidase